MTDHTHAPEDEPQESHVDVDIPPVVARKIRQCAAELAELVPRVSSVHWEVEQLGVVAAVLADDPTGQRLLEVNQESGYKAVSDALLFIADTAEGAKPVRSVTEVQERLEALIPPGHRTSGERLRALEERVPELEALAKSIRAKAMAEDDVGPVEGQDCPCSRAYGRMRQDHHDWLLGFEERGVAGVGEIIDYLESDADDCGSSDVYHVPWMDFADFMALHNWREPAAVHRIALYIEDAIRTRRGLYDKVKAAREHSVLQDVGRA